MLNVGVNSGCLTVISNDFEKNYQMFLESIIPLAEQEWNKFDEWTSARWTWEKNTDKFESYYKLNKAEKQAFNNKLVMPDSFVKKYCDIQLKNSWRFLQKLSNVLYHKKNPNTYINLVDGLKKHEIYEIKCNICGRKYFADEISICCVKRRSCSGAECLSNTVSNEKCEYDNLCIVNDESTSLQMLDTQIASIENISNPLSYYGGDSDLHTSYISDIHLLHHLSENVSLDTLIRHTIKQLYPNLPKILYTGYT